MQFNTGAGDVKNEYQSCGTDEPDECDLELNVLQAPTILVDKSPKIIGEGENAEVFSVYKVIYEIKNNYYHPYDDTAITYIADSKNPEHWLFSWEDDLDLKQGKSEEFSKSLFK